MKINKVEDVFRERGQERGTLYMFQYQQERINSLEKQVAMLAGLMNQMIDTMANVVNGTTEMRKHMLKKMAGAGLIGSEEDDLDPSTQNITQ